MGDFLGAPVVKNPPANAGDTGLIPGLGKSPMPLGNQVCIATTEPELRNESSPPLAASSPRTARKAQRGCNK